MGAIKPIRFVNPILAFRQLALNAPLRCLRDAISPALVYVCANPNRGFVVSGVFRQVLRHKLSATKFRRDW